MSIHNIHEYQKAKIIVKELEKVIKILNATEAGLSNYMKYRPVQNILNTIAYEKSLIQIYLEQHRIIVETKGQRK